MPSDSTLTHDIIVIGTSAGGVQALSDVVAALPPDLPATLFIVIHLSPQGPNLLGDVLRAVTNLSVRTPADGETFERGTIYIAPADCHLLVQQNHVRITRGPRENRCRPAIDPLFRSAAISYRSRVIGVLLTGLLDDGAAGLVAIQRCGGLTIVQEPREALWPDMPLAALELMRPDYISTLKEIGGLLTSLVQQPAENPRPVPLSIALEAKIAEGISDVMTEEQLGELVPLSCPECGGPLWEIRSENFARYRCHVGHAFTAKALLSDQRESIERALWGALRALKERAKVLSNLAKNSRSPNSSTTRDYEEQAENTEAHIQIITDLLPNLQLQRISVTASDES